MHVAAQTHNYEGVRLRGKLYIVSPVVVDKLEKLVLNELVISLPSSSFSPTAEPRMEPFKSEFGITVWMIIREVTVPLKKARRIPACSSMMVSNFSSSVEVSIKSEGFE
jgi:hypothetical protein